MRLHYIANMKGPKSVDFELIEKETILDGLDLIMWKPIIEELGSFYWPWKTSSHVWLLVERAILSWWGPHYNLDKELNYGNNYLSLEEDLRPEKNIAQFTHCDFTHVRTGEENPARSSLDSWPMGTVR